MSGSEFNQLVRESGNGGVFEITSAPTNGICVSNVKFRSCKTESGKGGGMYIGGGIVSGKKITFESVEFEGYGNGENKAGNGVYIVEDDLKTLAEYESWGSLIPGEEYDSGLIGVYIGEYGNSGETIDILHLRYAPGAASEKTVYVSSGGYTSSSCGWSDLPCHRSTKHTTDISLLLPNTLHPAETESTSFSPSGTLCVSPSTSQTVTKQVGSLSSAATPSPPAVFVVAGMSVTFSTLSLKLTQSTPPPLDCSLFAVTSGSLTLSSVECVPYLDSVFSLSAPLIAVNEEEAALEIKSCRFERFSLSDGNGAAIHATVGGSDSLSVEDTAFKTCTGKLGGAVYLNVMDAPKALLFEEITFEGNSASSSSSGRRSTAPQRTTCEKKTSLRSLRTNTQWMKKRW